ncbi:MAG: hypothetical protein RLZZ373_2097 [Pseudomonadota bacterium]|jgi:Protein of unknown function (DUF1302)
MPISTGSARQQTGLRLTLLAAAALLASGAHAVEIDTGNPDMTVRWDNTFKASGMVRLKDADPLLANSFGPGIPQALNLNAGDDNFRNKGVVSKRVDVLSEFDVIYQKRFGLRLSAAGWYDAAYHGTTNAVDQPGPTAIPGVFGPGNGQPVYNQFPESTSKLAGRKAEVLDAFVFGAWNLGEDQKLTARLGRHAIQYGESLFFGDNGIARAQGPVDVLKLQSSPNAQFKEIIRPVPQISTQLQLSPGMSVGGYYQFGWEADRLAPAGSYFSTANTGWGSPLPEYVSIPAGPVAGNYVLAPGSDMKPPKSGQFGAQFKWRLDETDLGFYAVRYHDKSGQLYSALNFANPLASQYFYVYPKAINAFGFSASQTVGDANVALEASVRTNMPLVNHNTVYPLGTPLPELATGRTAHVNLSWMTSLAPNFLAREATLLGEIAWNRVLSMRDPAGALDGGRTRDATALQFIFSPSYRQIAAGLDLSVPIGLRYALDGRSAITGHSWGPRGTGSATVGLEGNYEGVWQFTLTYNKFIGKSAPFVDYTTFHYTQGNPLADRDFVSMSLRRTF